ncbi:hypothetical protein ACFFLM_07945 [Deinococcus oregonensis]|uniref:Transposase n=1 Tax=Deinococcus oregonensis TaxID=1805970 RepID=A0ABV6B0F1_9DEIO
MGVHPTDLQDRLRAVLLFNSVGNLFPRMQHVWADAGSTGKLSTALKNALGWTLQILKHPWSGNLTI